MPAEIARQWFVPGDGIDRSVISSSIQKWLGNDATVRPGVGTEGEFEGVDGFWIRAYRNLTTAMIEDLQKDTLTWRRETQRAPAPRGSNSPSYNSNARNAVPDVMHDYPPHNFALPGNPMPRPQPPRSNADSPMLEAPFTAPSMAQVHRAPQPDRTQPDRMQPMDRNSMERIPGERVQADQSVLPQDTRFLPPGPPISRTYLPDNRQFPREGLPYNQNQDMRGQSQDQEMQDGPMYYPPTRPLPPYDQDPRASNSYLPNVDHSGFVRPNPAWAPVTSPYDHPQGVASSRSETAHSYSQGPFNVPSSQLPLGPDPRDTRHRQDHRDQWDRDGRDRGDGRESRVDPRDPRDTVLSRDSRDTRDTRFMSNEYPDQRYNYPSPALTVSTVSTRDAAAIPSQQSYNGPQGHSYTTYGQPVPSTFGAPSSDNGYTPPPQRERNQPFRRDREPQLESSSDNREPRRRRVQ